MCIQDTASGHNYLKKNVCILVERQSRPPVIPHLPVGDSMTTVQLRLPVTASHTFLLRPEGVGARCHERGPEPQTDPPVSIGP